MELSLKLSMHEQNMKLKSKNSQDSKMLRKKGMA